MLSCMHAKFCKKFPGLSAKAANLVAMGGCGQTSIFVQRKTH